MHAKPVRMHDPLVALAPLMKSKGVTATAAEFHEAVNLVFHAFESKSYDEIHQDMWNSLPQQFDLLVDDCAHLFPARRSKLTVLDIGCGTGLSSEMLLRSHWGELVGQLDLLDTSPEMQRVCAARESIHGVPHRLIQGMLHDLPPLPTYDLILASSLLHHIPDLQDFTRQVAARQKTGGIFVHLQDPNGDYLADLERLRRCEDFQCRTRGSVLTRLLRRLHPARIRARLRREPSYLDSVNTELLRRGLIAVPMTEMEIWSVTDIHVHNGRGISIRELERMLPGYDLIGTRSYGFFGELLAALPPYYQSLERDLIERRTPNGSHIAAAWIRRR
jgi:SAM-dependent methyltransferase